MAQFSAIYLLIAEPTKDILSLLIRTKNPLVKYSNSDRRSICDEVNEIIRQNDIDAAIILGKMERPQEDYYYPEFEFKWKGNIEVVA